MIRIILMYLMTMGCFVLSFDKPLQLLLCYPLLLLVTLVSVFILENRRA